MSSVLHNESMLEGAPPQDTVVLEPPAEARPFSPEPGTGPAQWVDYFNHPAYVPFRSPGLKVRLEALGVFLRALALVLCKRLIAYELIPAELRTRGGMPFLRAACANVARRFTIAKVESGGGRLVTQALRQHGIAVMPVSSSDFALVERSARPLLEALRRRRGARTSGGRNFIESRGQALRTSHAELFDAVERMFAAAHVLQGVSAYLGRPARLVDVNPQINDRSDDFWQQIFTDLPATDRPARYFHKDASGGDVKAIVYLSDVDVESGPFSYAVGSQAVRSPRWIGWLEEACDQSGLSATNLQARRLFAALPAALRRKCAVGNDLLPNSPVGQALLSAEWVVTARRGHVVLFDTKGFHRGGMVERGERLVLTCVMG